MALRQCRNESCRQPRKCAWKALENMQTWCQSSCQKTGEVSVPWCLRYDTVTKGSAGWVSEDWQLPQRPLAESGFPTYGERHSSRDENKKGSMKHTRGSLHKVRENTKLTRLTVSGRHCNHKTRIGQKYNCQIQKHVTADWQCRPVVERITEGFQEQK